jgi:hypothetical protein
MYYVYIHYTKDTGIPFYVGKGQGNRKDSTKDRNQYWKNKVCKHGFYSEVVFETIYEQEALNREKSLIQTLKYNDIKLCNLTDGGEGISGYKHTKIAIKKIRESSLGRPFSIEARIKLSQKMTGNKNGSFQKGKPKLNLRGSGNPAFKGFILATNIVTGETTILDGKLSSQAFGFDYRKVSACVNNKRKTHKGYTFKRIEGNENGSS